MENEKKYTPQAADRDMTIAALVPDAPKKSHGLLDTVHRESVKIAGTSFLIGDSAFLTSGYMAGRGGIGAAGILGLTEGAVGARYGNPKAEKQLEQLDRHLGEYLRKKGITIPSDPSTAELSKKGGVIDHVESFLYAYPTQVMTAIYSLIGAGMIHSGVKDNIKSLKIGGAFMVAASVAGLLIPERKPDPDHPPQGALQKAVRWVEEKPLRITGTLMSVSPIMLAKTALEDRKRNPQNKSYVFTALAAAGFLFGNAMLAISSKEYDSGGHLNDKALDKLATGCATVIAAQPKEVQEALLQDVTAYLARRPNVPLKQDQISEMLHRKLDEVTAGKAPGENWQERVGQDKAPPQPAL